MSARGGAALIVDVDEPFRRALRHSLTSEFSFQHVVETETIEAALEKLGEGIPFAIAVFDLFTMGEQSAENLRTMRACFPDMPIAIVSASTARRDILLALEAGAHGYIPKASGMRIASAGLRAVLGGVIYVPASIAVIGADEESPILFPADEICDEETMNVERLTPRQSEVLHLVVEGKSNKEIARYLNLAEGTIKVHMSALFRGLGVTSRSAAAARGARIGARIRAVSCLKESAGIPESSLF